MKVSHVIYIDKKLYFFITNKKNLSVYKNMDDKY